MMSDCELLRLFAERGDEPAFTEVVRRQAGFVYSVALRVCCNPHLAEDVTQAVFSKMARDAVHLARYRSLAAWLHTTARHCAIDAVRAEARRRTREQEAALMQSDLPHSNSDWAEIAPLLDEAVDQLGDRDRQAVLLRFFTGLSHQEIGDALGLSENAANKCVERALEKLRSQFTRRGVTVSSALLATTISTNSIHAAPVGLVERITPPALAQAGAAGAAGLAFFAFMSSNLKTTLAIAAAAVLVVAVAFNWPKSPTAPAAVHATPATPAGSPPSAAATPVATAAVAAPIALPAAKPAASATPPVVTGPQAELNSSMDEIIAVLQTGDGVTAFERFMSPEVLANLTPEAKARFEQQILAQLATPKGQEGMQQMIEVLQGMKTQAPELNGAGDRATYPIPDPSGIHSFPPQIEFQKINGKWYVLSPHG